MSSHPDREVHNRNGFRFSAMSVALIFAFSAHQSFGEEVTVQNDDFESGEVVIVGDFIAGEEAAAWLTSPCDGAIVAVQVAWLEGTPGHGQSLEEAIWIREEGSFPSPGAVLAQLVGPVMTPGYINEFRYLDQAQTIAINVPVTAGQVFQVALEFANGTNVGGGGPSVVRDWDGCQSSKNGIFAIPGGWIDWCTITPLQPPKGDFVIRAVIDCGEPTGACCDAYGLCTNEVEEGDCQGVGETFFEGQTCGEVTCPEPTGACCNGTGGCLNGLTQDYCENTLSWIYAGHSTFCEDDICKLGACCMPDGSCQEVVEIECVGLGGAFQGPDTECATAECPQPEGACCLGELCIEDQTEENCLSVEGVWVGAFTDCGPPDPCLPQCGPGDCDCDEDVDLNDFITFSSCFGLSAPSVGCPQDDFECADLNDDATIDLNDFITFANNFTG